jgi:RNA polymerase sigma-70 factor (ECF subfamily)
LIVLDRLTPAERVAFVLHDLFAVPFEEIAPILARSATATRQCASRARRHIRDSESAPGSERLRRARLVDAFLAAAHRGDFAALVELLDPDAVLRCDAAMVALGGPAEARGAAEVATRARQARGARPALIDGAPAAAWLARGQLRVVLLFGFAGGRIATVDAIAQPEHLARLDLVLAPG